PLALGWTRFGAAARIATAWGAICMTLCVVVDAVIPPGITIFTAWHDSIASHQFAPALFSMALGPFGWILHVGLVVGVVVGLRRSLEHTRSSASVFETVSSLPAAPA